MHLLKIIKERFWPIYCVSVFCGIVILILFLSRLPHGRLRVSFLNIGQGDSIFIFTPSYHTILIDGGPDDRVLSELGEVLPFFERTLDLVVLTHPHADHINGLISVIERYDVRNILMTGVSYESRLYQEFLDRIRTQHIPLYIAKADLDFSFQNEVFFDILYPFKSIAGETIAEINNSSIVMNVRYQNRSIFLSGDAEIEVENLLLNDYHGRLDADILKVGHHGSKSSSSSDFLQAISPEYAVIQAGFGNRYHHPHTETLDRFASMGITIFRNDLDLRVTIDIAEDGVIDIKTVKQGKYSNRVKNL